MEDHEIKVKDTPLRIYKALSRLLDIKYTKRAKEIKGLALGSHFILIDAELKDDNEYINSLSIVLSKMYFKTMKMMGTKFVEDSAMDGYTWRRKPGIDIDLMSYMSYYMLTNKKMEESDVIFESIELSKQVISMKKEGTLYGKAGIG